MKKYCINFKITDRAKETLVLNGRGYKELLNQILLYLYCNRPRYPTKDKIMMVKEVIKLHCLLAIALTLLLSACKGSKRGTSTGDQTGEKSTRYVLKKINQNTIDVDWLNAKARIKFQDEKTNISGTAVVRLEKDKRIWMVVKKFGIEGARILIRPDSVFVLDRLNSEYHAKDFSFVQQQLNMELSFIDVQDLLLGNIVLMEKGEKYKTSLEGNQHLLQVEEDEGMAKQYWLHGSHFYPEKMHFEVPAQKRKASIGYGDYNTLEKNMNFSYFRDFNFSSPETGEVQVELKYSKVEVNQPKELKFEVPGHYRMVK